MSYGNPNHTAAFKLFNYYNTWLVPANAAMSERTLNDMGYIRHPNEFIHRAMAEELHTCYITTAKAAELMENGVLLAIADPMRAKDIFGIISEHLLDWKDYLQHGDPTRRFEIPLDGLIEFYKLAERIIFVARGHGYYDKPEVKRRFKRANFNDKKERSANDLTVDSKIIKDIIALAADYDVRPSITSDFLLTNDGEHEPSRGAIGHVKDTI